MDKHQRTHDQDVYTFAATTLNSLDHLQRKGKHSDCFLQTEDRQFFAAHKAVLSSCSDYFKALFCGPMATDAEEDQPKKITVSCPSRTVSDLLEFVYTGRYHVTTEEDATAMMLLADIFIIPEAVKACEKFLVSRLSPNNCLQLFDLSKGFYFPHIHEKARQFIAQLPIKTLIENEYFSKLSLETLDHLLSDDCLNAPQEDLVLQALLQWISIDRPNRLKHYPFLFKTVRLGLCSKSALRYIVANSSFLDNREIVLPAIHSIMDMKKGLVPSPSKVSTLVENIYWFKRRIPSAYIFIIGGWSDSGVIPRMDVFNPNSFTWTTSCYQDVDHPRAYHGLVKLGTYLYCLGGYNGYRCMSIVRRFDLEKLQWTFAANMHQPRCYGAFTVAWQCCILAAGGFNGQSRISHCEVFDKDSNSWTTIACMREKRSDASAAYHRSMAFVAGGYNGSRVLSSVEVYRTDVDAWTIITTMSSPRSGFCLVEFKTYLLVIGGFDGQRRVNTVECCDFESNCWNIVSRMRNPRSNFACVTVNDFIYVIGGYLGEKKNNSVERIRWRNVREKLTFDDSWLVVPDLPEFRSALSGCAVSGYELNSLLRNEKSNKGSSPKKAKYETSSTRMNNQ